MELERGFRVYDSVITPLLFNRSRSFAVTLRFRASYVGWDVHCYVIIYSYNVMKQ
jgi:hypothetical protein